MGDKMVPRKLATCNFLKIDLPDLDECSSFDATCGSETAISIGAATACATCSVFTGMMSGRVIGLNDVALRSDALSGCKVFGSDDKAAYPDSISKRLSDGPEEDSFKVDVDSLFKPDRFDCWLELSAISTFWYRCVADSFCFSNKGVSKGSLPICPILRAVKSNRNTAATSTILKAMSLALR